MDLLDVSAPTAMTAADMTVSLAVMACRPVPILTHPSAKRTILLAIPFASVTIHFSNLPYLY